MNHSKEFSCQDIAMMKEAIAEAHLAGEAGDVPVGAILTDANGHIIARGRNTREVMRTALGHAELTAISDACAVLGGWRLSGCTLYVTLEPCPMCAGALMHARVSRIVCGAADPVAGAMGSVWALHRHPITNTHTMVEMGCLETECRDLMQRFFRNRREASETDNG